MGKKDGKKTLGIDASRANCRERTGVEWYSYHLIQALKEIIPSDTRVILYSREPLCDGLEIMPANWQSRVLNWRSKLWTQIRLSWEMVINPPDFLFVPAHVLPLILPRASAVTLHDLGFLSRQEAYAKNERRYHRLMNYWAIKRASKIITVSEFSKRELIRYFNFSPDNIAVTPLACDRRIFLPAKELPDFSEKIESMGLTLGKYFLFVGRLESKKGIETLMKAYGDYVHEGGVNDLVLIGRRGWGAESVFSRIDKTLVGRVKELGYVANKDLPYAYAGATAFILPSIYEGFGMPVLEAFSAGVPVVISNAEALTEVAGGAAMVFQVGDADALRQAMFQVDARRQELILKGFARVLDFNWQKTAELTWLAILDFFHD